MAESPLFGVEPKELKRLIGFGVEGPKGRDIDGDMPTGAHSPFVEAPGDWIGPYRLVSVLGEGGTAVVYLAEQTRPVRRSVALKIIKPGMDSQNVLRRFEAEAQALALMEHPHIARVYDAGLAPSGRPYFVMEHVKGIPINEHCDRHNLTVEQRLQLFLRVCEAVQHAHQKGIIHRDLKPSNILVIIEDQEMVPKVIDFGVARAISQPLTQQTLFTEQGQLIGTPEYMSPEQANLTNQDLDTRTDIYSLGMVLYELLTGTLPFDPQTLRTGGIDHIRKVICEDEPQTPSTRLSRTSLEEATESARRRQTDQRSLQRRLRGDLDWITLKALEKDRARRYATVEAFAEDIRRHLSHQPVAAAPPGVFYRMKKLARRHRQAAAAAAAALVLLCVLLWAVRANLQAGRERTHAEALQHERILAEARTLFETRGLQTQDASGASGDALTLLRPILNSRYVGPQARLLFAGILVEGRRYEEATAELQPLLQERPEIAGAAHALLARMIWESKALGAEALQRVEVHRRQAERLLPRTAEAYYLRALTALTIHERLDLLSEALRLDPSHYPSRRLRALTYLASRKYERLKEDTLLMTYSRPGDSLGHALRARALYELGDYTESLACYETAITLTAVKDPTYAELNSRRCDVLMRMGQYERAIVEVRECLKTAPEAKGLRFQLFAALTAFGRYEQASSVLGLDIDSDSHARAELRGWSTKYIFDVLDAGSAWHPPDSEPAGRAFLLMLEAEGLYHSLSTKARRLIKDGRGASLSPDGTKLVFCMGIPGGSGIALYDLQSGQTDLLIAPGQDPAWSPDGRHIVFARDRPALRLSQFAFEQRKQVDTTAGDELWVMNADGSWPRRLARGAGWPSWGPDGTHLYYQSRGDQILYRMSIEDAQARPVPILFCSSDSPSVSPDAKYVAEIEAGALRIIELATKSCVAEWTAPLEAWSTAWSPDGREISFGSGGSGLWIYDLNTRQALRVLRGPMSGARWSQDKRRLLIAANGEIWVTDLHPGVSTAEALGPAQTVEECLRELIEACNHELAVAPYLFGCHCERTTDALWIDHPEAPRYLLEMERAADQTRDLVNRSYGNTRWFLMRPGLRDRLLPLILLLARKMSEREASCARGLAPVLYEMGQDQEAIRLWRVGESAAPQGFCLYDDQSDSYTIRGYGIDIGETCDDFHFAFKQLHGDGSIMARIDTIDNIDPWTKAAVMIRSSLAPDSSNVMLLVTPSGRLSLQYRIAGQYNNATNSVPTPPNSIELPYWVRVVRRGNRFTAQHSADGITWQDMLYGPDQPVAIEIPMDETVYIGLAVTSHNGARAATAHFSHVSTTGDVRAPGPFIESQDIHFQPPLSTSTSAGIQTSFRLRLGCGRTPRISTSRLDSPMKKNTRCACQARVIRIRKNLCAVSIACDRLSRIARASVGSKLDHSFGADGRNPRRHGCSNSGS
jgi:serine/threonine protein kinase/tetratricopeptide (TPR) repeat protein